MGASMHYDNLSMDLYLRDGCGGVVKINCTQACPTMSPKEMVEYLASRFGQTVIWSEGVKVVDASPEAGAAASEDSGHVELLESESAAEAGGDAGEMPVDDPSEEEAEGLERAAPDEAEQGVPPKKATNVIRVDRAPDEMYAGLTCSMGGDD